MGSHGAHPCSALQPSRAWRVAAVAAVASTKPCRSCGISLSSGAVLRSLRESSGCTHMKAGEDSDDDKRTCCYKEGERARVQDQKRMITAWTQLPFREIVAHADAHLMAKAARLCTLSRFPARAEFRGQGDRK